RTRGDPHPPTMLARQIDQLRTVRQAADPDRNQDLAGPQYRARDLRKRLRGRAFDDHVAQPRQIVERHDLGLGVEDPGCGPRAVEMARGHRDQASFRDRALREARRQFLSDIAESREPDRDRLGAFQHGVTGARSNAAKSPRSRAVGSVSIANRNARTRSGGATDPASSANFSANSRSVIGASG